ncbi:hypothetical protein ACH4E7_15990 [Kitasatospora sp. NPDC018058]|uniref:hypothetical protein n=1 Tax=Kitasatospora sp. NPDC018058 TaxID=3364025 RepID=UPI0037BF182A
MRSTPRTRRAAVPAASGIAVVALVTDCGPSGYTSSTPGTPSSPSAPAAATLQTATDPELGTIVTDSAGFTRDHFDQDKSNPSEPPCNGSCATVRPPEHADGDVTRSDGTEQVTLDRCRPLSPGRHGCATMKW